MPTWLCGLRRLPIAPAYRIAGSNPRQELEVSSHSTPFKKSEENMFQIPSDFLQIFFSWGACVGYAWPTNCSPSTPSHLPTGTSEGIA
ncbi:hypothetical protein AVEN_170629-1 [Araneus ventricosus]|uniref:Uncharacterized protein n=1 Tax=Araneus ventricosus TaxID=182803 RepID=A0A4Y2UHL8_ARAVE|nr:hypothetical protein AVEN_170629-1 [Araneus ventricosus]